MRNDLLKRIAAELKDYGQFMGSKWGNCEAEVLAMQTLGACALNLEKYGEPFSWLMTSAMNGRQQDGTNNANGLRILLDDKSVEVRDYDGPAAAPVNVARKDGKPQVLVVTDKMLTYAASMLEISLDDEKGGA